MTNNWHIKKLLSYLFLVLAVTSCNQAGIDKTKTDFSSYVDEDWDISFFYPSTMVPQSKTDSRIENNVKVSSNTIQLSDRKETSIVFIQIAEDPLVTYDPEWFPPSNSQLKIFAALDIGILQFEKSEQNKKTIDSALQTAEYDDICDFPSIRYRIFLNDTQYGHIYVRGASVITPIRSYTIMVIGGLSKEGQIHKTVKPERVDEIWNKLLETISISY
jgi:hypothetical protein